MESKLYKDEKYLKQEIQRKSPAEIAKENGVSKSLIYSYLKKYNIEINKEIVIKSNRKYTCNHDYFKVIDTPNKAYWLGFIMADGNIDNRKDRPNTHRLTIKLSSKDEEHLYKFLKEIQGNYKITHSITHINGKEYKCSQLRVNSSILCKDLMNLGVLPNKSCNEIFPLDKIPKEYWKDFIRGEFDGDGCFSYGFSKDEVLPKASFHLCGSEQMLKEIINIIKKECNINVQKIRLSDNNKLYVWSIGGNFQVVKVMEWLYNSNEKLERKFKKYKEFLEEYNNPKYDEYKQKSNVYI